MTPKAARAFRISVIDDKIEELIQFHVRLESCLRLELARHPKDLAKLCRGLSPEKRELIEQMYSDEHYLLETILREIFAILPLSQRTRFLRLV